MTRLAATAAALVDRPLVKVPVRVKESNSGLIWPYKK